MQQAMIVKPPEQRRKEAMAYHVHSPADQSTNFVDLAEYLATHGGVTFGNALDTIVRPLVGGDLVMILARTGNGKTTTKLGVARNLAESIMTGNFGDEDSIVIFVTLEQAAGYIELMLSGNESFDSSQLIRGEVDSAKYKSWSSWRPQLPLWVIGETRKNAGKKHSEMYMETITEAIEAIIFEHGKRPAAIFVDYLQQIRMRDEGRLTKNEQVMSASAALKRLAVRFDVPVIYGSQAAQRVDDYKDKLPKLNDSMWSADASHLSDIVITILRTAVYWSPLNKPEVEVDGRIYDNRMSTMVVKTLKQRYAPAGQSVGVSFMPQTLIMEDMNTIDISTGVPIRKQEELFEVPDEF